MTAKWREKRGGTREKREVKAAGSRLTSNQRVLATPTHRPDEHGSLPIPTSFLLPRPAFYLNALELFLSATSMSTLRTWTIHHLKNPLSPG